MHKQTVCSATSDAASCNFAYYDERRECGDKSRNISRFSNSISLARISSSDNFCFHWHKLTLRQCFHIHITTSCPSNSSLSLLLGKLAKVIERLKGKEEIHRALDLEPIHSLSLSPHSLIILAQFRGFSGFAPCRETTNAFTRPREREMWPISSGHIMNSFKASREQTFIRFHNVSMSSPSTLP